MNLEKLFFMVYLKNNRKGSVLVLALIILGVLGILAAYFVSFSTRGAKMSESQKMGTGSYYLSEAGINEAIWKLGNDDTDTDGDEPWETCFISSAPGCNCDSWEGVFTRNYTDNSTTTVSIKNSECARGKLTATTTLSFGNKKAGQRVVEVEVFRSVGDVNLIEDSPVFAGSPTGESTITASRMNVHGGNLFSNNNVEIQLFSNVDVSDNPGTDKQEGKALASGEIDTSWFSGIDYEALCTENRCSTVSTCECETYPDKFDACTSSACPPITLEMPAINFDSIGSPFSYKAKAEDAELKGLCSVVGENSSGGIVLTNDKCIYTESEFSDMLWQVGEGGELILENNQSGDSYSVYYVEGNVDLMGGRYLTINGLLAADSTVNIGEEYRWNGDSGFNQLIVNDPGPGIPSGIITKGRMNFGPYSSFRDLDVEGIIYSQDEMRLVSIPHKFEVHGGILARRFYLISAFSSLDIYLDNTIVEEGITGGSSQSGGGSDSPVITVEHWEESY